MKERNRIFFLKLGALAASVILLQVLLVEVFGIYDKTAEKPGYLAAFNQKTDVVYFGDSTVNYISEGEQPEQSLIGLLMSQLPDIHFNNQGHAGHNIGIWKHTFEYLSRHHPQFPELIVLPINLGCFDLEWTMGPSLRRDVERIFLSHDGKPWFKYFYKFLFTFGIFEAQAFSDEEFAFALKNSPSAQYSGVKRDLVRRYMTDLSAVNPEEFRAFDQVAAFLRSRSQNVLFYLTPIDHEVGEKWLGSDFRNRLNSNIEALSSVLGRHGYSLENYAFFLSHDAFDSNDNATEHLRLKGRLSLAKELAKNVKMHLGR